MAESRILVQQLPEQPAGFLDLFAEHGPVRLIQINPFAGDLEAAENQALQFHVRIGFPVIDVHIHRQLRVQIKFFQLFVTAHEPGALENMLVAFIVAPAIVRIVDDEGFDFQFEPVAFAGG